MQNMALNLKQICFENFTVCFDIYDSNFTIALRTLPMAKTNKIGSINFLVFEISNNCNLKKIAIC